MTLQPYFDRILLKRKEAEKASAGGIILGTATDKNNLCTVVAVGNGYLNSDTGETTPLKTEVGATVMIGPWTGDEIKVEGVEHLMIRESEILALVKE